MKKTLKIVAILLMFVSVMFALTGCKNEKKDDKKAATGIVGTWKYENGDYTYHFNEDGTGDYSYYSTKMEFTYKTEGNKLSITYNGSTAPFETQYEIKDNKLNIIDSLGHDTIYVRQ